MGAVHFNSWRVTPVQPMTAMSPGDSAWQDAILGRGLLNLRLRAAVGLLVSGLPVLEFHSNWEKDNCERCPEQGALDRPARDT